MAQMGKKSFNSIKEVVSGALIVAFSAVGLAGAAERFEINVTKHATLKTGGNQPAGNNGTTWP